MVGGPVGPPREKKKKRKRKRKRKRMRVRGDLALNARWSRLTSALGCTTVILSTNFANSRGQKDAATASKL
jgi:hypothetical protein